MDNKYIIDKEALYDDDVFNGLFRINQPIDLDNIKLASFSKYYYEHMHDGKSVKFNRCLFRNKDILTHNIWLVKLDYIQQLKDFLESNNIECQEV